MAMNPGLAAFIAKKKGGKVDPNNDGDGKKESQETPADKAKEAKNGGKPTADMIRSNKLKQLAKSGGK